jgi:hypothetical protein
VSRFEDISAGGFHWTKTDTIITICVCLGFGMLVKTLLLILYLKRKYTRRQQQHRKEGEAYDDGKKQIVGYEERRLWAGSFYRILKAFEFFAKQFGCWLLLSGAHRGPVCTRNEFLEALKLSN